MLVDSNASALGLDYTLNEVLSNASILVPSVKIQDKSILIVRVDLSTLKISPSLWDNLTFDEPYFTNTINGKKITVFPNLVSLITKTGCKTPIVDHRWLQVTLNGTKYYSARGISKSSDPKQTDFDKFLRQFSGVTVRDVEKLRSDQKYALLFSGVTAKPRAVLVLSGFGSRPGTNQNLVMITQDVSDRDTAAIKHPIRSLLDFKPTASEVIIEMNNGLHVFGLFNGAGVLQTSVPPDVAKDHTVPIPYTAELIPRISCIRCHASEGGIRSVTNDVAKLSTRLEIFDSDIDRLAGLYAGSLSKPFERARADYSDSLVILRSKYDIPDNPVNLIISTYSDYLYTRIDMKKALFELGLSKDFEIPDLNPEDPIVGALKVGLSISRLEFEQIFPDLLERSYE